MPHDTRIVAIINVTPDSFSDGGQYAAPDDALAAIRQTITDGADVIDIGAESTRPGATPLSADEEWQRLEPVLAGLLPGCPVPVSVDTYHADNAARALGLGAGWINDVSGFGNPAMVEAVKDSDCKLVMMHSLSVPADTHHTVPDDVDPVQAVLEFAQKRIDDLQQAGIARERLLFDPGIGFGKTAEQSRTMLARIGEFKALGLPLFVGHSRKSFLGLKGQPLARQDAATLEVSRTLARQGVEYIRVHNVPLHRAMLDELAHVA